MYELDFNQKGNKPTIKNVKGHQYYVFPRKPHTHANQVNRPRKYADPKKLVTYKGAGSNGKAMLLPDIVNNVNAFMTALLDYGKQINDWSMLSTVVQVGFYADDPNQGEKYANIIKQTVKKDPKLAGLTFPDELVKEAQSVLGPPGDPRRAKLHTDLAKSPGWNAELVKQLFYYVDNSFAPRGSNPHATGLVFDLDFSISLSKGGEHNVGINRDLNDAALLSAAGMWINQYSMQFHFDSYNTDAEIWHMEWRNPKP
jgi:hypothetical protein